MSQRIIFFLLVLPCVMARTAGAAPTITIKFAPRAVTASGVSPGAQILFFAAVKIPMPYYWRLRRWQFVSTDDDHDGVVTIQTQTDIPKSSVWVVADLRNGQLVTTTPDSQGLRTVEIGRTAMRSTGDRFSFDRSYLDLVYVHAGEGAWIWHAVDGGAGDEDGPNGLATIDIGKASRAAGTGLPTVFSPSGTLVAIDFLNLQALTVDVQTLVSRGRP